MAAKDLSVDALLGELRNRLFASAQAEGDNERLHLAHGLVARGELILEELATWRDVAERASALAEQQTALRDAKGLDLPAARERLAEAETEATMAAYAEGAVAGKNADHRKVELDAYLAGQQDVVKAREHLRAVETRILNIEAAQAVADSEYKAALGRWHAAQAGAELLAAMLMAVAGR